MRSSEREEKKTIVIDTGILISFLEGDFKELFNKILNNELEVYINAVNLTEAYYVLCRKIGEKKARQVILRIIRSGYFHIVNVKSKILKYTAECKCKHSISLADCFSIGTAKYLGVKVLFRREKELENLSEELVDFIDK